jgi:hypothetical protein
MRNCGRPVHPPTKQNKRNKEMYSPEMEEKDGGLLGDVLNPGTEEGIADEEDPAGRAVAPPDPSSRCWVMSRRRD